jgi:hypothetical protein
MQDKIIYEKILNALLINNPDKFLLGNIKNYNDIIAYSEIIKESNYSEKLFDRVLSIICEKQKESKKFRKNDCFKLVNKIRKKNTSIIENKIISKKVFFLFKENILSIKNEDITNRLSVTLKNCLLEDLEIAWLISNHNKNVCILNRILRYPVASKLISEWASSTLVKNINHARKRELIGWIVDSDYEYQGNDLRALIWGICYSRCPDKIKRQRLTRIINDKRLFDVVDDVVDVCRRLDFLDILEQKYIEKIGH